MSKGLVIALVSGLAIAACGRASFEIVRKKTTTLSPLTDPVQPTQGAPQVKLEVIEGEQVVTQIKVGTEVIVRPSADSHDAEDVGVSNCPNPGLVKAEYDLANGEKPVIERSNCDSLATKTKFTTAGDYSLKVVVSSAENETAEATATLKVVADNPGQTPGQNPGQNTTTQNNSPTQQK